jgi:hypothetical protein
MLGAGLGRLRRPLPRPGIAPRCSGHTPPRRRWAWPPHPRACSRNLRATSSGVCTGPPSAGDPGTDKMGSSGAGTGRLARGARTGTECDTRGNLPRETREGSKTRVIGGQFLISSDSVGRPRRLFGLLQRLPGPPRLPHPGPDAPANLCRSPGARGGRPARRLTLIP